MNNNFIETLKWPWPGESIFYIKNLTEENRTPTDDEPFSEIPEEIARRVLADEEPISNIHEIQQENVEPVLTENEIIEEIEETIRIKKILKLLYIKLLTYAHKKRLWTKIGTGSARYFQKTLFIRKELMHTFCKYF